MGQCYGKEELELELELDKNFGFGENIWDEYEIGEELGKGHFGHTFLAHRKNGESTDLPVAVKIISKDKITSKTEFEHIRMEVIILKALSGEKQMLTFHGAFEDSDNVYIVTEFCEGGELMDQIEQRGRYPEKDAKAVVVQILSAVAICHDRSIVHRDLKAQDEDYELKLIDFGLSQFVKPGETLSDAVGTPLFVAPDVLRKSYNLKADMWSIGVMTYMLLCGELPFSGDTVPETLQSVLEKCPNYDGGCWHDISREGKEFVKKLLTKVPGERMAVREALDHEWLKEVNQESNQEIPVEELPNRGTYNVFLANPPTTPALIAWLANCLAPITYIWVPIDVLHTVPTDSDPHSRATIHETSSEERGASSSGPSRAILPNDSIPRRVSR